MTNQTVNVAGDDTANTGGTNSPAATAPVTTQPSDDALKQTKIEIEGLRQQATDAEKSADEWKSRFTGMQGTYQREQKKWKTDIDRVSELEGIVAGFDDERTGLQTQITDLTEKSDEMKSTQVQLDRMTIISLEFPDLLSFENDGLLPKVSGDDLREKLGSMRTLLKERGKSAVESALEGTPPAPPVGQEPKTKDEIQHAMVAAFKKGDMESYNSLQEQFYSLLGE